MIELWDIEAINFASQGCCELRYAMHCNAQETGTSFGRDDSYDMMKFFDVLCSNDLLSLEDIAKP
jgi:hypothetical protein